MIIRLGDTAPLNFFGTQPPVDSTTGLPSFCDPDWTAINGGVCTDAMGQYRTQSGQQVTGDQILSAMKIQGYGAPAGKTAGLNVDPTTLAFILGGVFFFALIMRGGRR